MLYFANMFLLLCFCVLLHLSFSMKIDIKSVNIREWDNANNSEIRCYCNLPQCITTSYMCKSEGLGCFSDILAYSDVTKARQGCLDLLEEKQHKCQNEPSGHPHGQVKSLMICCYQDLCNHADSPEIRQRYNDTLLASSLVNDLDRVNSRLRSPGYTSPEVWFRAATIAVPICGALILFALIVLAVRILQSDAMDDRVLAAKLRAKQSGFSPVSLNGPSFVYQTPDHNRNDSFPSKKMPLLFQHETTNTSVSSVPFMGCVNRPSHGQGVNVLHSCHQQHKNEANAKLNLSQNSVEPTITTFPVVPVHSTVQEESSETSANLIDLQKMTPCNNNCNIFQNEESTEDLDPACALLSAHKLTYKKPLVITWTDSDVKPSNSQ